MGAASPAVVCVAAAGGGAAPPLALAVNQQRLELRFPAGWLDEHPLTRADLEAEAKYLKKAGFRLEFG